MSLAVIKSRAQYGMQTPEVVIEVHLSNGLPSLSIVGLPEAAVKESKDRVRSAIMNSGFSFPNKRITINLAPADLPKEGGRYDLAIAIGILLASNQIIDNIDLSNYEIIGELSLTGDLRYVKGIIPIAVKIDDLERKLIAPYQNADEISLISTIKAYKARNLKEVTLHILKQNSLDSANKDYKPENYYSKPDYGNLKDVKGQFQARRALEIAASGRHNILFIGPPGTGKTMLASRLNSILPALSTSQAISSASIASIRGETEIANTFYSRPFRSPHHTSSSVSLVGGGSTPKPGEISLAHNGVLFLDELPEFNRGVLEALREPLESGKISISRARGLVTFPASFQLVAAMNPCPCGYLGSQHKECKDSDSQIKRYQSKLSGPLLSRIDLQVEVLEVDKDSMLDQSYNAESSEGVAKRVAVAQQIQIKRQGKLNADLKSDDIDKYCVLGDDQKNILSMAIDKLGLSARSYHRILKVARTIADLDSNPKISTKNVQEVLNYSKLDRYFK